MGQSKNPLTGEMQDIRDPEVERQFEKQQGEFSDQQRNLRTTRALTDAASAYFMPQAMAKAPQGLKTAWNKFAGNVLGNPDARFAVPGLGAERQAIPDPTAALFDTGPTKLINQPGSLTQPAIPIPNQSLPSVTCSCRPPVILTIIGVPQANDSNVARPNPSASEMLIVQSAIL